MRVLLILLVICFCGVALLLVKRGAGGSRPDIAPGHDTSEFVNGRVTLPDSSSLAPTFKRLSSPALEQRKAARRVLQRTGYVNVLADVVRHDGTGALLSLVRLNAQVSYSLSHRPIMLYFPIVAPPDSVQRAGRVFSFYYASGPFGVALHDDWTMPEDPWK